jgi:hypothetical protein
MLYGIGFNQRGERGLTKRSTRRHGAIKNRVSFEM